MVYEVCIKIKIDKALRFDTATQVLDQVFKDDSIEKEIRSIDCISDEIEGGE